MDQSPTPPTARISRELADVIRTLAVLRADEPAPEPDADLFDEGYLDSLGTVALTAHIETTYGVVIADEDLFDPACTTLAGLSALIAARIDPDHAPAHPASAQL